MQHRKPLKQESEHGQSRQIPDQLGIEQLIRRYQYHQHDSRNEAELQLAKFRAETDAFDRQRVPPEPEKQSGHDESQRADQQHAGKCARLETLPGEELLGARSTGFQQRSDFVLQVGADLCRFRNQNEYEQRQHDRADDGQLKGE